MRIVLVKERKNNESYKHHNISRLAGIDAGVDGTGNRCGVFHDSLINEQCAVRETL